TPWKEDLGDAFLREFEVGKYLGGVYTFGFRGSLLGARENRPLLTSVLRRMKKSKAWFASASQLTEWWSKREKIRVDCRRVHQHRIRVAVTNRGRQEITGFTIDLHLPYRPKK